jgi:iron complex outermembrane receptor protein
MDTVVVTGTHDGLRLDESASNGALGNRQVLDTPFSVTVIDSDEISRRQATSVAQIFINDPSVFSSSIAGMTNWWGPQIRGLGVRNFYVDGVPLEMSWGGEVPLEMVESVEALKGLTGFMYGFGAPGGLLKYETKKPTDSPIAATELGYRNDSAFFGSVDVGGRLKGGEGLGYRVNLGGEYGDAYTTAGQNRYLAAVAVDHGIGENLKWYANFTYEDSKLEHEPLYFYWDGYEGGRLPTPNYDYEEVTVKNSWYKTNTRIATTGLQWRINDAWNADFSAGYSRKEHLSNKMFGTMLNEAGDYTGSAYNFTGLLHEKHAQAIVQGQLNTGSVRHELVFGASYLQDTGQWSNEWYWSDDFEGNLYEQQTFVVTRDIDFSLSPIKDESRQAALFASDTLYFGERWQAILGARFTDYTLKDTDQDPTEDSGYDTDALTPTIALIYKPAEHSTVYGSYVEALEAGRRVGEEYANVGDVLDATISKQYEVGFKYENGKLGFTTAAFRVERAGEIDKLVDERRYLTQDGLTLYEGLEAIGSYNVTDALRVGLGATWLDAHIEDVSPENVDLEGKIPAGAAEWQILANAEYDVTAVAGLSVHGTVRYFGDAYYEDLNLVNIPSRTLANVGFQYATAMFGEDVVITCNINNVFNKKYWELDTLGESINGSLSMRINW